MNVAARLEQLAEPGGVCSAHRLRQLNGKLALRFDHAAGIGSRTSPSRSRPGASGRPDGAAAKSAACRRGGSRKLAIAGGPGTPLLLASALVGWRWYGVRSPSEAGGPPALDRPAIAVLPFDDFGGEERQQRLADAFTEDLITELARSRELLVIARNSVEAFKGKGIDVRQVGRELGVRYVLEGSLQAEPERVRITAQLIEASTGTHLWSERYDRPANDLFAVRDEVLNRLVGTLTGYDGPIWAEWREAARRKPPQSLGAWDYFLLANRPYRRHDKEGNAEARQLLEKAIELDPRFARAWAFLADTHVQDAISGWTGDRARSWELHTRPYAGPPSSILPTVTSSSRSGARTSRKTRSSSGSRPGSAPWHWLPTTRSSTGRSGRSFRSPWASSAPQQGVELVNRALQQLDPFHPPYHYLSLGIPLYFAGRYAEAVAALEKVPDPWLEVRVMLALSSAQARLQDKARRNAEEVLRLEPGFTAEAWVDNDFYQPGGSSAALFFDGARKAGLPLCAKPEEAAKFDPGNRLPECEAERAKAAAPKM